MPRGIPNRKPELTEIPDPQDMTPPEEGTRMAAMLLKRHYRPAGFYEIIGHHTRPVIKKSPSGDLYEAVKSEWKPGEKAEPPVPGAVGFADKIWSGTVIRIPVDEAKNIQRAQIGEPVLD